MCFCQLYAQLLGLRLVKRALGIDYNTVLSACRLY
jgi:hypothetical protein